MENTTLKKSHIPAENAENNSTYGDMTKNTLTFERTAIEGTPFVMQWSESKGYSGGIAEHRVTEWYKTEEELKKKLKGASNKGIDWDLLTGVILILIEKKEELKKITESQTKEL